MKVKWEDSDGREFSIRVISKKFDYTFIPGDTIDYDRFGRVEKIGPIVIDYDRFDRVEKVGPIVIDYDRFDRVEKVGSLEIDYDRFGRVEKTIGRIK